MTPIADPRAVEAAEKYANPAGLTKVRLPVKHHMERTLEDFLAGWQARSAAGPATREQGSEKLISEALAALANARKGMFMGPDENEIEIIDCIDRASDLLQKLGGERG